MQEAAEKGRPKRRPQRSKAAAEKRGFWWEVCLRNRHVKRLASIKGFELAKLRRFYKPDVVARRMASMKAARTVKRMKAARVDIDQKATGGRQFVEKPPGDTEVRRTASTQRNATSGIRRD